MRANLKAAKIILNPRKHLKFTTLRAVSFVILASVELMWRSSAGTQVPNTAIHFQKSAGTMVGRVRGGGEFGCSFV